MRTRLSTDAIVAICVAIIITSFSACSAVINYEGVHDSYRHCVNHCPSDDVTDNKYDKQTYCIAECNNILRKEPITEEYHNETHMVCTIQSSRLAI